MMTISGRCVKRRKNMKKRILTTLLTVVLLTAAFSVTALAWDGWTDNGGSWSYYQNDQPVTGWLSLNGTWYYIDNTGIMTIGWQNVNGTWYYMDDSGAMATGWQWIGDNWYFMDSTGAMRTGWITLDGARYFMDNSGAWNESRSQPSAIANISEDEAYEIACEYWNYTPGCVSEDTGYKLFLVYDGQIKKKGNQYYIFRLRWWIPEEAGWGNRTATIDSLYVNAKTGECTYSV